MTTYAKLVIKHSELRHVLNTGRPSQPYYLQARTQYDEVYKKIKALFHKPKV